MINGVNTATQLQETSFYSKKFVKIMIIGKNFVTSPSDVRDRSDRKGVKYFKVVKVVKGGKEVKGVEWVKIKRFIGFNGLRS